MPFLDEEEPAKSKKALVVVGEDLANLSEEDLAERVKALKAEITRVELTMSERSKVRSAADALFKTS